MMRSFLAWANDMWPWRTPLDRRNSLAWWAKKAEVIRTNRITQQHMHRNSGSISIMVSHSKDANHCVCNGTHVNGSFCPRCQQPFFINGKIEWI